MKKTTLIAAAAVISISFCLAAPLFAEEGKEGKAGPCRPMVEQLKAKKAELKALEDRMKTMRESIRTSREAERKSKEAEHQKKMAERDAKFAQLKLKNPEKYAELMAKMAEKKNGRGDNNRDGNKQKPTKEEMLAKMQKEHPDMYALMTQKQQLMASMKQLMEDFEACRAANKPKEGEGRENKGKEKREHKNGGRNEK